MQLTPLAKALIALVVVGAVAAGIYKNLDAIAPEKQKPLITTIPGNGQGIKLPDVVDPSNTTPKPLLTTAAPSKPGCLDKPEVRFYLWAWNAQAGLMLANGGAQAAEGSLMCKNNVNLKLTREDNVDKMQSLLMTFAEAVKGGDKNPKEGAHFVAIMGDGSASFFKGLNDRLKKLGPDYIAQVVGSTGYSRGEDKFMGPPAWKLDPQKARGGLVAGYLRDGDWNIAMKWLADNQIPNNPDDTVYDPDALNWVNANDYIDAAQKYVTGYCTELKNKKTGAMEKHCVDAVVTWTPGDVTIAEKKGGLTSIVSTKEYRSQMPNVIIGNKKWMSDNRETVQGMLSAIFEAGDQIKKNEDNLKKASAISAIVYNEADADYWTKYFTIQKVKDAQGLEVELGGSSVNNLADNLQLFGLVEGSTNLFAATYEVFGNIVMQQYPSIVSSIYPTKEILDTSYVQALVAKEAPITKAEVPVFNQPVAKEDTIQVGNRAWAIEFASGKDTFTPKALLVMEELSKDLVIAGGTRIEIHGHTDNQGGIEKNQLLSEARAFAVKTWLEKKSPTNFPEGRIKVFAHGQLEPVAPNTTPDGKAKNRRVEIKLLAQKS
jgi:OmpA-OmpF porin, OOP family